MQMVAIRAVSRVREKTSACFFQIYQPQALGLCNCKNNLTENDADAFIYSEIARLGIHIKTLYYR